MPAPLTPSDEAPAKRRRLLEVPRFAQPDEFSCGPTCLLQIYRYFGDLMPFEEVLEGVRRHDDGGTLAVHLGAAALHQGYAARLVSWNLRLFDPTWARLETGALRAKLRARAAVSADTKRRDALLAYDDFLCEGGQVEFGHDLTPALLTSCLDRGHPPLVGISATHLYRTMRVRPADNEDDDVHGEPMGHFVVLSGYVRGGAAFLVRDPYVQIPFSRTGRYTVPAQRLVNAVLLGESTYDAVLLEVWPRRRRGRA
jgi:hypothetical protein